MNDFAATSKLSHPSKAAASPPGRSRAPRGGQWGSSRGEGALEGKPQWRERVHRTSAGFESSQLEFARKLAAAPESVAFVEGLLAGAARDHDHVICRVRVADLVSG